MSTSYKIIKITPDLVESWEFMGSKNKFWCRRSDNGEEAWLFKYPKPNTGEHWAEKIAADVARLLGIDHAVVELAIFCEQHGAISKSFTDSERFLWHGNQVLEGQVQGYDTEKRFHQSSHTLENIFHALEQSFSSTDEAEQAKGAIAGYFVLDALIGNTDRHHENWGLLRGNEEGREQRVLAPSYDHASSLGRELLDERRELILAQNRVPRYVEKGRGGVYWAETEARGPSPLELIRRATAAYPDFFRPYLIRLRKLEKQALGDIIDCVPDTWMSAPAKAFASALMAYSLAELQKLVP